MTQAPNANQPPAGPAEHRWEQVTARDLMRTDLVTISYAAPLSQVEATLGEHGFSGAPVVDESGHIVGVISIKDLIARYSQDPDSRPRREAGFFRLSSEDMGRDVEIVGLPAESEETAADLMTAEIYSVSPEAGLREIAMKMAKHRIHRIFVQGNNQYLGLISTMEILDALSA